MRRLLLISTFVLSAYFGNAQCPQVYDYLGNLSGNPYWISCTGGSYVLNFQSNQSWGNYTIVWGDASANHVGANYTANTIITHTYAATIDTFVVQLIIPALNCTLTGVVVMEKPVNASIQIPIGGVTQACAPANIQFVNSSTDVSQTTKFQWDFGAGSPLLNFNYTNATQTITHTYQKNTVNCQTQVTLKAWNYCSFTNTTIAVFNPIQIYDIDQAAITPDAFTKCWPENSFTFSNTTTRNCLAQGNTFQRQEWWNFGDYWNMNHDSIINWKPWPPTLPYTIAYPSVGSYTVMLRDSNMCGIDTAIITVNIVNPPTASIVAPTGTLCQNTAVTFTNASTASVLYKYDFGVGAGFVNLPGGPQSFTYTTAGTYTVKLVAYLAAAGACSDTDQVVIDILPAPVANFNHNPIQSCNVLNNVNFTDASINAVQWDWNFGNTNTSTLQVPPSQNYTSIGTHTITLTVTGSNTCQHTKTATVTVFPNPTALFVPLSTCVGSATQFTNQSTSSATLPITSYTWNFGDGSPEINTQNPVHTYTSANTYSVFLIVANTHCVDTLTTNVVANVKPTADFIATPTIGCPALSVSFNNTTSNGTSYLWNFGTTLTNTSSATNPTFAFTNTLVANQVYTVSLFAFNGFGCSDSIKKAITVYPKPIAGFTANLNPGCSPMPVTFTNTTTGATSYTWNFGDTNSSTNLNTSHTFTNNSLVLQNFTVTLIAQNNDGCLDSLKQVVSVFPKPFFNFTMVPASGCTPLSVNFPPVLGAISYTWNFGDGSPLSNASNPTHIFTNTTSITQNFTVTLIAQNGFGCSDTTSGVPIVFAKPTANYTMNPFSGCPPLQVTFSNTSIGNAANAWNFDNGNASIAVDPVVTFTSPSGGAGKIHQVKLLVVNADGCKDSIIRTLTLFARPLAAFNLDTPACSPKVMTFVNQSTGANSYNWFLGGSTTSTLTSPQHTFINSTSSTQTTSVRLIATNAFGCKDTNSVIFSVFPKPQFFISALPDSGCTPLTVNFPVINGVSKYSWDFGDGNNSDSGATQNIYVNTTAANKSYTVKLIAHDINNCSDTTTRIIKVFPKPTALFNADPLTVFIPNTPTKMFNLSSGASTYTWSFGDGGNSNAFEPSHTYINAGEYQIILFARSERGCIDTFYLPSKIIAQEESYFNIPNAFTPNLNGSPGSVYDPNDLNNDIFHPIIKGAAKYRFSIYSRWGELLFDTKDVNEGWDGYYKGKLCTQDVYVWKISATMVDGKTIQKTGDVLLLR
ncbi:MAG: PKD domain-containing protein [Bacteroidia bacterium]